MITQLKQAAEHAKRLNTSYCLDHEILLKLIAVIEEYEKALYYYREVYPEPNREIYTARARQALAKGKEMLK